MDVNATSTGTVTIGASAAVTTGTSTFSGAVRLQNLQAGVSSIRTMSSVVMIVPFDTMYRYTVSFWR